MVGDGVVLATITETVAPGFAYSLTPTAMLVDFQSAYQHVQVIATEAFGRVLVLDGSFQCSEADEAAYHEPLVHGAMLACASPRRVLIVGGGDGGAAEEVLKHPEVQSVLHVELDGDVIHVCRRHLAAVHGGVLDGADPRYRLLVQDGFTFLEHCSEAFDVIVLDLTDPGGPSSRLYSEPFVQSCADHLAPHGALSLHVGSAWGQAERIGSIATLLRRTFTSVQPMLVNVPLSGGPWLMAVCGQGPAGWPASRSVQQRLHALWGAPLTVVTAITLPAMRALPPRLSAPWTG